METTVLSTGIGLLLDCTLTKYQTGWMYFDKHLYTLFDNLELV